VFHHFYEDRERKVIEKSTGKRVFSMKLCTRLKVKYKLILLYILKSIFFPLKS